MCLRWSFLRIWIPRDSSPSRPDPPFGRSYVLQNRIIKSRLFPSWMSGNWLSIQGIPCSILGMKNYKFVHFRYGEESDVHFRFAKKNNFGESWGFYMPIHYQDSHFCRWEVDRDFIFQSSPQVSSNPFGKNGQVKTLEDKLNNSSATPQSSFPKKTHT